MLPVRGAQTQELIVNEGAQPPLRRARGARARPGRPARAERAHAHGEKGYGGGRGEVARLHRALVDAAEQSADRCDQADVRDEGDPLEADAQRDVALALGNQSHEPPVDHHACPSSRLPAGRTPAAAFPAVRHGKLFVLKLESSNFLCLAARANGRCEAGPDGRRHRPAGPRRPRAPSSHSRPGGAPCGRRGRQPL